MGKIVIRFEFDSIEDKEDIEMLMNHKQVYIMLGDFKAYLRENRKYKEIPDTFDQIDDKFFELLNETSIGGLI